MEDTDIVVAGNMRVLQYRTFAEPCVAGQGYVWDKGMHACCLSHTGAGSNAVRDSTGGCFLQRMLLGCGFQA